MTTATGAPQGGMVGEGTVVTGKVKGKDLTVLGVVEGEVQLEGRLLVGKGGRVKASVRAGEVEAEGELEGDVRTSSLTLAETARARGTFVAKRLVVKEGAHVEGAINPAEPTPATPHAPPAPVPPVPPAPPARSGGETGPKV
jgi:cytoskeletal protein CcmA (bactofilin family)